MVCCIPFPSLVMGKIFLRFERKNQSKTTCQIEKKMFSLSVSNRKRRIKNVCVCVKYYEGEPSSTKMLVDELAEKMLIRYAVNPLKFVKNEVILEQERKL